MKWNGFGIGKAARWMRCAAWRMRARRIRARLAAGCVKSERTDGMNGARSVLIQSGADRFGGAGDAPRRQRRSAHGFLAFWRGVAGGIGSTRAWAKAALLKSAVPGAGRSEGACALNRAEQAPAKQMPQCKNAGHALGDGWLVRMRAATRAWAENACAMLGKAKCRAGERLRKVIAWIKRAGSAAGRTARRVAGGISGVRAWAKAIGFHGSRAGERLRKVIAWIKRAGSAAGRTARRAAGSMSGVRAWAKAIGSHGKALSQRLLAHVVAGRKRLSAQTALCVRKWRAKVWSRIQKRAAARGALAGKSCADLRESAVSDAGQAESACALNRAERVPAKRTPRRRAILNAHVPRRVVRWLWAQREPIGYYAMLATVLMALGAAAYGYRSGGVDRAAVLSPEAGAARAVQAVPEPTATPVPELALLAPVAGEIVSGYAGDAPVWSEALGMWQIHPAVDFAASPGEAVVAAADGTVTEVYCDPLIGNVIAVDCGEVGQMRYASLNTLQLVEVGAQVRRGEIISSAGTCAAEAELGAHVHFEYLVDGSPTDPTALFGAASAPVQEAPGDADGVGTDGT